MKTSSEIAEILNDLERRFPVATWKCVNFDLWPLIKVNVLHSNEKQRKAEKPSLIKKLVSPVLSLILILLSFLNYIRIRTLAPLHFFVNFESHLFRLGNKSINKFYEKLIIDLELNNTLFDFNYVDTLHTNNFFSKSIFKTIHVSLLMKLISRGNKRNIDTDIQADRYGEFLDFLQLEHPWCNVESIAIEALKKDCISIQNYVNFWEIIFSRTKPKVVFTVCYYIPQNFGLVFAANKLNIPVIEIQHGNQINYPPYSFSCIPKNGYNTLPNYFITWDLESYDQLNLWVKNSTKQHVINIGNPWTSLWEDQSWVNKQFPSLEKNIIELIKPMILYSLVPEAEILPPHMKKVIEATQHVYSWYIRLHPRQINQTKDIKDLFSINNIFNVNIDQATSLPLPIILENCDLHITSWSSVVLEANQYGKMSVVIHIEGAHRYGNLKNVIVFNTKDNSINIGDIIADSLNKRSLSAIKELPFNSKEIKELFKII